MKYQVLNLPSKLSYRVLDNQSQVQEVFSFKANQTVHILQHDSAVTGSLPEGDICIGIPNLLPNHLVRKKSFSIFPSPAGLSLTKLADNYVIYKLSPPRESLVSDIPAGDRNIEKLFLRCSTVTPLYK